MQKLIIPLLLLASFGVTAQPVHYTTANAHSHNDYEQPVPFYTAYKAGFGSIEADIFLIRGNLIVAHDISELKKNRSIEEYYLKPLLDFVEANRGYPYADTSKHLQMLIDIKTAPVNTLDSFIAVLKKYPALISNPNLQWVITGNRPPDSTFASYPSFIWFDGLLFKDYGRQPLEKIVMMSDDFKSYSLWNGDGALPTADLDKIVKAIARCHALHKPVRFWDAPDTPNTWKQFMQLGVDFINTDRIEQLEEYLRATSRIPPPGARE